MFVISGQELDKWYQKAQKQAIAFDVNVSELDWLLQEVTELNNLALRTKNYLSQGKIKTSLNLEQLEQLWQKKINDRYPIQYLVGRCHWRNFTLKVTPDVLIPRPETELIIDIVADWVKENPQQSQGNWLDMGTGSGAIAIGLAEILPESNIYAVEKSESAIKIAQENAINLGYEKKIFFLRGSWFYPLENTNFKFNGIVSNPPYIPSELVVNLQPEVANFEPKQALNGGITGLEAIEHLIKFAPDFLVNKGILLMEIMQGQAETIKKILAENGNYINIKSYQDLAKIDRFIFAQNNVS